MPVCLELTGRSAESLCLATFYIEPQLLAVYSFEDTVSGPRIQLGEKPHRLLACRQCNRDRDSGHALGFVVMRAPECECCRQTLPSREVNSVLGLDTGHERGATVIGDGRIDFARRVADG